jgi:hypothetical protein
MPAGAIFKYLESSELASNTYIMLSSDNGAAIFPDEQPAARRKVSNARCVMQPTNMCGAAVDSIILQCCSGLLIGWRLAYTHALCQPAARRGMSRMHARCSMQLTDLDGAASHCIAICGSWFCKILENIFLVRCSYQMMGRKQCSSTSRCIVLHAGRHFSNTPEGPMSEAVWFIRTRHLHKSREGVHLTIRQLYVPLCLLKSIQAAAVLAAGTHAVRSAGLEGKRQGRCAGGSGSPWFTKHHHQQQQSQQQQQLLATGFAAQLKVQTHCQHLDSTQLLGTTTTACRTEYIAS